MTEDRQRIAVDLIHVPEDYVRPLDETAALTLSRVMRIEGQKTPIAVYESRARRDGKLYTLIYGRRRLRALEILGWGEIEAILRPMDETNMVALSDNLAMPSLDELERAEHLIAFRAGWEKRFGTVRRGGDRRSNGHDDRLIGAYKDNENPSFYKDLIENFGISERTARRLFQIARLQPSLRDALRGSPYANDQKSLKKLTKFGPSEQAGIAGAFKIEPDLDAVLRMDDPATGRKGSGRMETGDWREKRFREAWDALPRDRRAAALDGIGAMPKLVEQWPSHLPPVRAVPAPGNLSPLRAMLRDPYRQLSRRFTFEQVQRLKERYEEEEREMAHYLRSIEQNIQAQEEADRAAFNEERDKAEAKAVRARRKNTGLSIVLPRRETKMMAELDLALHRKLTDIRRDRSAELVRACHKLDEVRQAEMIHMLYEGCDYGLAIKCAQALHYDQLSKARGTARLEIEQPKIVVAEGRFKRLLPQLVSRLFALKIDRFYNGRSVFGTLTPEQQLEICRMLDAGIDFEEVELQARRISPNDAVRRRLEMETIQQRLES